MKKKDQHSNIPHTEQQMKDGVQSVLLHPFFGRLDHYGFCFRHNTAMAKDAAVLVTRDGMILFNKNADFPPSQWAWAAAHAMLHRAFGHFDLDKVPGYETRQKDGTLKKIADFDPDLWNTACDLYVDKFLVDIHFGEPPQTVHEYLIPPSKMSDELAIYEYLQVQPTDKADHSAGTAGKGRRDMVGLENPVEYDPNSPVWSNRQYNMYAREFALTLSHSVRKAVSIAAGCEENDDAKASDAQRAAAWFLNHYPLFGGMAAAFRMKEDSLLCRRNEIQIVAVDAEEGELYVNPFCGLSEEEWKFVLAHEFLHVGLQHHKRLQGRNPYLWNVACDYVINGWLHEMQVGEMPDGVLFDPAFSGQSAEEIYDRIVRDIRKYSKMDTLRGWGKGDILSGKSRLSDRSRGVSLDDFFRNALMSGLEYQLDSGRGTIPAGMIQEIRALTMPPIRWDVRLAYWFDENILTQEKHLSYAHPSRRQASSPTIPRPRYIRTETKKMASTFGVVIDTSGSMSAEDIGKVLGSIASYAASKDVPAVRVIFCDADAYDAGYLDTDQIAGRVRVVGRGGTRLQPAVNLLENAKDFPKDSPILLITDGWIEDHLTIRRRHAFLLPAGRSLPFRPKGEVFFFS